MPPDGLDSMAAHERESVDNDAKVDAEMEMNAPATEDRLRAERDRAWEALSWMHGSFNPDFEPGGQARKGWLKIVEPVLREMKQPVAHE